MLKSPEAARRSLDMDEGSLTKRRKSNINVDMGSAKRPRGPRDLSPEVMRNCPQGSTPISLPRIRAHRVMEVEQELMSETLGISFIGNEKLESPHFDKTKTKSFYKSCFDVISKLGKGSYGEVCKCRFRDDGKLYAVKFRKEPFFSLKTRENALQEVRLLEGLPKHDNIVRFVRAWQERNTLYIQTELCAGDLLTFLKNLTQPTSLSEDPPYMQPERVPEDLCWNVLVDLLRGAAHLHENNVIHLDIKPENVFIGLGDGRCKLGDFGMAWNFRNNHKREAQEGDGRYAAPETYCANLFTPKADVFSIGCTVLQLALGIVNPRHARYEDTWTRLKLRTNTWFEFEHEMAAKSDELWRLIRWLLTYDVDDRPTPQDVLDDDLVRARAADREKHLSRARLVYRIRSAASNVLQILATFLPRDLITRLRPLMLKAPPSPHQHRSNVLVSPATPKVPAAAESGTSRLFGQSLGASSTPSRTLNTSSETDEEVAFVRVNLSSRFSDVDIDDVSPIKKPPRNT